MQYILLLFYYMIEAYKYSLLVYILMSYFPQSRKTRLFTFLQGMMDPVLNLFRFLSIGVISFAPIVVFLLLDLFQRFIINYGEVNHVLFR